MGNFLDSYSGFVDMTENIDNSMPDVYKQGKKYEEYSKKVTSYRNTMAEIDEAMKYNSTVDKDRMRDKLGNYVHGKNLAQDDYRFIFFSTKLLNPNNDPEIARNIDMGDSAFWGLLPGGKAKSWIKAPVKSIGRIANKASKIRGTMQYKKFKKRYQLQTLPKHKRVALKKRYQEIEMNRLRNSSFGNLKTRARSHMDKKVTSFTNNPYNKLPGSGPSPKEVFNNLFKTEAKGIKKNIKQNLTTSFYKTKSLIPNVQKEFNEATKVYTSSSEKPMEGGETRNLDINKQKSTTTTTDTRTRGRTRTRQPFYTSNGYTSDDDTNRRRRRRTRNRHE